MISTIKSDPNFQFLTSLRQPRRLFFLFLGHICKIWKKWITVLNSFFQEHMVFLHVLFPKWVARTKLEQRGPYIWKKLPSQRLFFQFMTLFIDPLHKIRSFTTKEALQKEIAILHESLHLGTSLPQSGIRQYTKFSTKNVYNKESIKQDWSKNIIKWKLWLNKYYRLDGQKWRF